MSETQAETASEDVMTEIALLRAHVERLSREHARHSLALEAHKGRADQQESRAIRAEGQLARFASYVEEYDRLAEQAAQGQRDSDCLKELRAHLVGDESSCWLCRGLGGIAIHIKWTAERGNGKPLWTAREYPSNDPHPVKPCPVCDRLRSGLRTEP